MKYTTITLIASAVALSNVAWGAPPVTPQTPDVLAAQCFSKMFTGKLAPSECQESVKEFSNPVKGLRLDDLSVVIGADQSISLESKNVQIDTISFVGKEHVQFFTIGEKITFVAGDMNLFTLEVPKKKPTSVDTSTIYTSFPMTKVVISPGADYEQIYKLMKDLLMSPLPSYDLSIKGALEGEVGLSPVPLGVPYSGFEFATSIRLVTPGFPNNMALIRSYNLIQNELETIFTADFGFYNPSKISFEIETPIHFDLTYETATVGRAVINNFKIIPGGNIITMEVNIVDKNALKKPSGTKFKVSGVGPVTGLPLLIDSLAMGMVFDMQIP
ncbi:hypothetical protein BGZ76_006270 [Entomortierella beljakovae]|nr:hypothetical protein BGZ76_006270 [Entomortierella beljakovae]